MIAVGVVARSEARGLGYQTLEVARHVEPAKVLLVEPQPSRHPTNRGWYDRFDTTIVPWALNRRGSADLPEHAVRRWLTGLDIVYTAETLYDWRLAKWAADVGCVVVCHVNPELLPPEARTADGVVWWAPTSWLIERLPDGTKVVPLPVALDRIPPSPPREDDQPCRFVHVAGHAAMLDRNGTRSLAQVIRRLRCPAQFLITGQDGTLPSLLARDRRVKLSKVPGGLTNYWDAYVGDVLVNPRRYGGLSMPSQEAMAAGMCVLMPDCSPNGEWPGPRVATVAVRDYPMLGGRIPVHEPDLMSSAGVRGVVERLARDRDEVEAHKADARAWAAAHSWEALLPVWRAELEAARACR